MHIIVDAMGGDHGPAAVVEGCLKAVEDLHVSLTLVGKEAEIQEELEKHHYIGDRIQILPAEEVIDGNEDPLLGIKKKNSSMRIALSMLKHGEGDALVSSGSTGALIAGSTLLIKRIPGVRRVALAPVMPTAKGCFLLLDAGANVECTPAFLKQFAIMGSIYMESVMEVKNPRVKLINIGSEENKGPKLMTETHGLLKEVPLRYEGYIEGRDIPLGGADVVVCDGVTGNVVLKFMEGMGMAVSGMIKGIFLENSRSRLAALLVQKGLRRFKKTMDYTEYGGAPVLGASKPVIKAHGSSDGKAFYHAIRQAKKLAEEHLVEIIEERIAEYGMDIVKGDADEKVSC